MRSHSEKAVSPVIAVILMVAVTVILSAAVGAFVFNLGNNVDSKQSQALGVTTTETETGVEITIVSGQADELQILLDGEPVSTMVSPVPGNSTVIPASAGQTITLVTVNDGSKQVVRSTSIDSTSTSSLEQGLIAHYRFEAGDGSIAYDTAQDFNGNISGATWTTQSQVGSYALSFDKTDDYVNIGEPSEMESLTEFTASVWVYVSAYDANQVFFAREDSGGGTDLWGIRYMDASTSVRGYVRGDSGTFYYANSTNYTAGKWEHWAITFSNGDFKLYRNGNHVDTTNTGESVTNSSTANVKFGMRDISDSNWVLGGKVDDGRFYNRALSSQEVADLYNATK